MINSTGRWKVPWTCHTIRKLALVSVCFFVAGCAMVKPDRHLDEVTPIDWGMNGESLESAITILPFDAQDEKWGAYAAQRMKEHLLEEKAFQRVVLAGKESVATPYVLTGELEYLFYGGTHSPSRVCVSVRVMDASDGHTRFLRISRISSEKKAFHVSWLSRVYMPSPYPEELLNALLRHIAQDIAVRTARATTEAVPLTRSENR
jgi:hypothetical protein